MAHYTMVIDLTVCTGCRACEAACALENQTPYWDEKYRTHVEDIVTGSFPDVERTFLPHMCMQCEEPACVEACPTGASYIAEDTGIVLIDHDVCIDCRYCVAACPYGARYEYTKADQQKAVEIYGEAHGQDFIDKCTLCEHRIKQGMEPACVTTCLAGARIFGDLDDPDSEVSKLVNSGRAKPLAPEAGTHPKIYFIADKPSDMDALPVDVAAAGMTHAHTASKNIGTLGIGVATIGALGVYGYARKNAKDHFVEVAAELEKESEKEAQQ